MKQVVIIGGSFAAAAALKSVLAVQELVNIIVIAPSDFAWNNAASPRLLIEPERKQETIVDFRNLVESRIQNSIHQGKFIKSTVTNVDLDERKLSYDDQILTYDYLIIASGSRYINNAFKLSNSCDYKQSFEEIDQLSQKISLAKTIAIIGGGATGVEVAGEIGFKYGKSKKIDLFTGSLAPLPLLKDSTRKAAITKLSKLNVNVMNNIKVKEFTETSISYDQEIKNYDLVVPTFKSIPNTDFLPEKVLSSTGYVLVNNSFILKNYPNVIAFGDVAHCTKKSIADIIYFQSKVVKSSVNHWFSGLSVSSYSPKQMLLVAISKNGGVGEVFGLPFPSVLIKIFKSRDYGIKQSANYF